MINQKKKLTILIVFLLVSLLLSFLYEPLLENLIRTRVISIEGQAGIQFPPFSPNEIFPFGTDLVGFTIFSKLLQGFKYTFIIVFLLSVSQLLVSFFFSFSTFKLRKKS